jgi:hypothetical protein
MASAAAARAGMRIFRIAIMVRVPGWGWKFSIDLEMSHAERTGI